VRETEEGCGLLAEGRGWGEGPCTVERLCREAGGVGPCTVERLCRETGGVGPCTVERLCREAGGGGGTMHGSCCGSVVTVDVARPRVHCYVAQCCACCATDDFFAFLGGVAKFRKAAHSFVILQHGATGRIIMKFDI
jgi:hypothetical protein